jgi:hypothetical protein
MPAAVSSQIAAAVAIRAGRHARATEIADVAVGFWREIELVLTPIIGRRGVAALHSRSLFLTAVAHPWLSRPSLDVPETIDHEWLHRVTAARPPLDASAGTTAQLTEFEALLSSMIGSALTVRLLRSVWEPPPSGDAAQDMKP